MLTRLLLWCSIATTGLALPAAALAAGVRLDLQRLPWPAAHVPLADVPPSRLAGALKARADLMRGALANPPLVAPTAEVGPPLLGPSLLGPTPATVRLRPGQALEWADSLVAHGVFADRREAELVAGALCDGVATQAQVAGCWLDLLMWAQDALVVGARTGERAEGPPRHRKDFTSREVAARKQREQDLAALGTRLVVEALAGPDQPFAAVVDRWLAALGPARLPTYGHLLAGLERYRQLAALPVPPLPQVALAPPYAYKHPRQVGRWLRRFDTAQRAALDRRLCFEGYCRPLPGGAALPTPPLATAPAARIAPVPVVRSWVLPGDRVTVRRTAQTLRLADAGDAALDPGLRAQIEAFQADRGLRVTGLVDRDTLRALRVPMTERVARIRLALQRIRDTALPRGPQFLLVNVPAFRLDLWRDGRHVRSHAVQVGLAFERKRGRLVPGKRTPLLSAGVSHVIVDPAWYVPGSILHEVFEEFRRDPEYMARNKFEYRQVPGSDEEQLVMGAGPENLLGEVKLHFPNPHLVFAHDTPSQWRFLLPERMTSHGCVRVHDASTLARELLSLDRGAPFTEAMWQKLRKKHDEKPLPLRRPVDIHVVYWTADAAPDGTVRFYRDHYRLDPADLARVEAAHRARTGTSVAGHP